VVLAQVALHYYAEDSCYILLGHRGEDSHRRRNDRRKRCCSSCCRSPSSPESPAMAPEEAVVGPWPSFSSELQPEQEWGQGRCHPYRNSIQRAKGFCRSASSRYTRRSKRLQCPIEPQCPSRFSALCTLNIRPVPLCTGTAERDREGFSIWLDTV